MNFMSGDMQLALANDRIDQLRAEAASHRRSRIANGPRSGAIDRVAQAINRGWASIGERMEVDRRPRLPAI